MITQQNQVQDNSNQNIITQSTQLLEQTNKFTDTSKSLMSNTNLNNNNNNNTNNNMMMNKQQTNSQTGKTMNNQPKGPNNPSNPGFYY